MRFSLVFPGKAAPEHLGSDRSASIGFLKAIAIVTVVAIHSFQIFGERQPPGAVVVMGVATRLAAPGFFLAAGFLAERASTRPAGSYLAARLKRLLLPYLIASSVTLASPISAVRGRTW